MEKKSLGIWINAAVRCCPHARIDLGPNLIQGGKFYTKFQGIKLFMLINIMTARFSTLLLLIEASIRALSPDLSRVLPLIQSSDVQYNVIVECGASFIHFQY